MLAPAQRSRLQAAHAAGKQRTTDRLTAYGLTMWNDMGSWRESDTDRFIEQVVPRVVAGRNQVAASTAVYLARVAEVEPSDLIDAEMLRGKPAEVVYGRPAQTMARELGNGAPLTEAVAAAANHLRSLIATDMQMAMQRQTALSTGSSPAYGRWFKRVVTGRENCAKCLIASTQHYSRGNLLPIHPGCDCGVEPMLEGEGNEQVIDPERLENTHDWVSEFSDEANRSAFGYQNMLVTSEHGEYGPTLRWRTQKFTGPSDI